MNNMISMKTAIIALACTVIVISTTTVAGHQSKPGQPARVRPDLSGKWILDLGNSKLGRERALIKIASVSLVIFHEEPVLQFTETTDYEGLEVTERFTCFTDGRGETNRTPSRAMAVKSKTRWKGSQLVTRSSRESMVSRSGGRTPERGENDSLFDASAVESGRAAAVLDLEKARRNTTSPGFDLGPQVFVTTVKREMSADGQTLTITTSWSAPYSSTQVVTKTFKRAA